MTRDDDAWRALATDLGARRDARDWLHVAILGRTFSLMRTELGGSRLVVAHSLLAPHLERDPAELAASAGRWPVGGVVLHDGWWVSRHTFVGVPAAARARDVLTGIVLQLRELEPMHAAGSSPHAIIIHGHYAD